MEMMMPKILMVDDDGIVLLLTYQALRERVDVEIKFRQTGADALELLANERFDLMITDWTMPSMMGGELIEQLRSGTYEGHSLAANCSIPVIVLSGVEFPTRELGKNDQWSPWEPIALRLCSTDWDGLVETIRRFVPLDPAPAGLSLPKEIEELVASIVNAANAVETPAAP